MGTEMLLIASLVVLIGFYLSTLLRPWRWRRLRPYGSIIRMTIYVGIVTCMFLVLVFTVVMFIDLFTVTG